MNDKIHAWEGRLSQMMTRRQRNAFGSRENPALVSVTTSRGDQPSEALGHRVLRVSFHRRAMEKTGWEPGDRLDVDIKGNEIAIYPSEDGQRLSDPTRRQKGGTRLFIQFNMPPGLLAGFPIGNCIEPEIQNGRIVALLPKR